MKDQKAISSLILLFFPISGILLFIVFVGVMSLFHGDNSGYYRCELPKGKKIYLDSMFARTEAVGLVKNVDYYATYGDHDNYTFVEIEAFPDSNFIGQGTVVRQMRFNNPENIRLGFKGSIADHITEGDTFVKRQNSVFFEFRKLTGDTLKTELNYNGRCDGRNCRFDRHDGLLCCWSW